MHFAKAGAAEVLNTKNVEADVIMHLSCIYCIFYNINQDRFIKVVYTIKHDNIWLNWIFTVKLQIYTLKMCAFLKIGNNSL